MAGSAQAPWIPRTAAAVMAGMAVAACANQPTLSGPVTGAVTDNEGAPAVTRIGATSVDVYSRIALGAQRCWFGPHGALKPTHIFHADVEPPERGGLVDIGVHERDWAQSTPWGNRAYTVKVSQIGEQAAIETINVRMPAETADAMRVDVERWARGAAGCGPPGLAPVPLAAPTKAFPDPRTPPPRRS